MNMSRKLMLSVCALTLSAVSLTACSSSGTDAKTGTSASATNATAGGAAPVSNGAAQVKITAANNGKDTCNVDHLTAAAGPITFTVSNESSTAITEVELLNNLKILGEKENVAPGLAPVNFTVTLDGGDYTIYCPGAEPEKQTFKVTGKAAAAATGDTQALLAKGATDYGTWAAAQIADMQVAVGNLQKAVDSGDVNAVKQAYVQTRPFYEKVESAVEGFILPGFAADDNKGNLDYLIDMRESSLDEAVGWSGFHAIERDVFKSGAITDETKKYAADLVTNTGKLAELTKDLTYKPEDLANGAAGLLEEVQANKITGEEEAYSHIDLVDFANNVEGAAQAFANLQPGLEKIDPDLSAKIVVQFNAVDQTLQKYRDPSALGGYMTWTDENRNAHAKELSQAVLALQQPLQNIAEKVATAQ